jgi:RNA polymerase sigma-70 factor (ECF subfamily)
MWPESGKTQELLKRVADHDPAAAGELWARHRAALRRMIDLRLDPALGRRVDANQRLAEYLRSPALPFHLWLRQIARDHIIDQHRRHRVAGRRSLDRERPLAAPAFADRSSLELAAQLRDPGLTPAAAALRAELGRRFQAALAQLDEDDREIILLRHFEQLSNGDAARALGVSEPAAGMRHLRALRRLRAVLGEPASRVEAPKPRGE